MEYKFQPFQVERGKIKEFAKSLGYTNPIYFDVESAQNKGYRDIPAPPTFPTVIDFWNDTPYYTFFKKIGLLPEFVLHGEQTYQYKTTICAGDTMTGKVKIISEERKKGKVFYHLETTYTNQFGEIAVIGNATIIDIKGNEKV